MATLEKELSEFVRPSLVRALAALGKVPEVQKVIVREANRGLDFFRSTVIEAIGDYKVTSAVPALAEIAKLDGPLQDDAAAALGQIGDEFALETLVPLQRGAPRDRQPALAAAICLIGTNCYAHDRFLEETLRFTTTCMGFQDLARSASRGRRARRARLREGREALIDFGVPSEDPVRAPVALALVASARAAPRAARRAPAPGRRQGGPAPPVARPSTCSPRISPRSASTSRSAGRTGKAPRRLPHACPHRAAHRHARFLVRSSEF